MAEANKYDLGSDWSWADLDSSGLPPEKIEALKAKFSDKFKNVQRGQTKTAEELAQHRRQLDEQREQVEWAQRWRAYIQPRKHLFDRFNDIEESVAKVGGVDALKQRAFANAAAPTADHVTTAAAHARKSLSERWQNQEISLEDMQKGLQEVDEQQAQLLGQLPRYRDEMRTEVGQELGNVRNQVSQLEQRMQGNMAGMMPFALAASQYQTRFPDRDVMQIYETARRHGLGDFNQAAAITYGQQDLEATVERQVTERMALEKENLERRYAAQETNPEGGSLAQVAGSTWRRQRHTQVPQQQQPNITPPSATKDPAELDRRVMETLINGKRPAA